MSFNLRVIFAGVGCYVPNQTGNRRAMWVYPDASLAKRSAIDNCKLRPHKTFVRFPLEAVPGWPGPPGFGIWPLVRTQLTIATTGGKVPPVTLESALTPAHVADQPADSDRKDLVWVPKLRNIFSGGDASLWRLPDDVVTDASPPASVGLRVLLDRGHLVSHEPPGIIKWEFRPRFDATIYKQGLANHAAIELGLVDNVHFHATRFDALGTSGTLTLTTTAAGLDVTIGNLCEDPLEWLPNHSAQEDDLDFKWIYELFGIAQQAVLKSALATIAAPSHCDLGLPSPPIPRPPAAGMGEGGRPIQCYFVESDPVNY